MFGENIKRWNEILNGIYELEKGVGRFNMRNSINIAFKDQDPGSSGDVKKNQAVTLQPNYDYILSIHTVHVFACLV